MKYFLPYLAIFGLVAGMVTVTVVKVMAQVRSSNFTVTATRTEVLFNGSQSQYDHKILMLRKEISDDTALLNDLQNGQRTFTDK